MLYDYTCPNPSCGWKDELFAAVEGRHRQKCPQCGTILSLSVHAPLFKLAGGGWARDGYHDDQKEALKENDRLRLKQDKVDVDLRKNGVDV